MKSRLCFDVLKRLFAIVLCAAISVAYLPLIGQGGKAFATPAESTWKANDVESVDFIPADENKDIFYEDIDADEDGEYYVRFSNGDRIVATLTKGGRKTLEFVDANSDDVSYWLIKEENKRLSEVVEETDDEGDTWERYIEPSFDYEYDDDDNRVPWTVGGDNKYRVRFGAREYEDDYGDTYNVDTYSDWRSVSLLSNPVTAISFTPSPNSEPDRFTCYEGDDEYSLYFLEGDKLDIVINGTSETYEYNSDNFYNGNKEVPERYGYPVFDYGEPESWNVGDSPVLNVEYAGKKWPVKTLKVLESPIESLSYSFARNTRTLAEINLRMDAEEQVVFDDDGNEVYEDYDEDGYGIGDPITETVYRYYLYFEPEDTLEVKWKDGRSTTYTYDEYSDPEDGWEEVFIDSDGETLSGLPRTPYYEAGTEKISVTKEEGSKDYMFKVWYKGKCADAKLSVTYSSDEEIAVEQAREDAYERVWNIEEKYDISNKISKGIYRPQQRQILINALNKALEDIEKATTIKQLNDAVATYENIAKTTKTNAQLTAEEKDWDGTLSGAVPAAKGVKVKAAKKKITVSWKKASKKNLKKFDKVEIQVCPDKGFSRANTKRIEVKKSKKSATVKGLTKGKTYYVRVRDVKGSGATKLVSKWSKVKKAKVKK